MANVPNAPGGREHHYFTDAVRNRPTMAALRGVDEAG